MTKINIKIVGDVQCSMAIATATQYATTDESQSGIGPVPHFIKSHMISGIVSWNDEAQIQVARSITDKNGKIIMEYTRKAVPAARTVYVSSIFDESFHVQSFKGLSSVVSDDGEVSQQCGTIIEFMHKMVSDEIKRLKLDEVEDDVVNNNDSS